MPDIEPNTVMFTDDNDTYEVDPADVDWRATAGFLQQEVTRLGAERDELVSLLEVRTDQWRAAEQYAALREYAQVERDVLSEMLREMARRVRHEREAGENLWSALQDAWADIDAALHAGHGPWRRWRLVHRATSRACLLGLIAGRGVVSSRSCRGCLTFIAWRGPRPYILGRHRAWWSCLILGRHLRRETTHDDGGTCSVCAPCRTVGSPEAGHDVWACAAGRAAVAS